MCIALPMFTNVSIDWKLPSYKIPPLGTPLPPPLLPRSERPFRQSHSVAKVNFLPLNTSKFKDTALVYR